MRLDTTYAQTVRGEARSNTNVRVFEIATAEANKYSTRQKHIEQISDVYKASKLKMLQQVIAAEDEDPIRYSTFKPGTVHSWDVRRRKRGRPREWWGTSGTKQFWGKLRQSLGAPFATQEWSDTPQQVQHIEDASKKALETHRDKQSRRSHGTKQSSRARCMGVDRSRRLNPFGQIPYNTQNKHGLENC